MLVEALGTLERVAFQGVFWAGDLEPILTAKDASREAKPRVLEGVEGSEGGWPL